MLHQCKIVQAQIVCFTWGYQEAKTALLAGYQQTLSTFAMNYRQYGQSVLVVGWVFASSLLRTLFFMVHEHLSPNIGQQVASIQNCQEDRKKLISSLVDDCIRLSTKKPNHSATRRDIGTEVGRLQEHLQGASAKLGVLEVPLLLPCGGYGCQGHGRTILNRPLIILTQWHCLQGFAGIADPTLSKANMVVR